MDDGIYARIGQGGRCGRQLTSDWSNRGPVHATPWCSCRNTSPTTNSHFAIGPQRFRLPPTDRRWPCDSPTPTPAIPSGTQRCCPCDGSHAPPPCRCSSVFSPGGAAVRRNKLRHKVDGERGVGPLNTLQRGDSGQVVGT
jgi:hypothetical protein